MIPKDGIIFPHSDTDWLLNKENSQLTLDNILKMVKVDKTYDVPYLAGYSVDGKNIYIDKDFENMGDVDVSRFIVLHEVVEKALLMWFDNLNEDIKGRYMLAHQVASQAELEAVRQAGLDTDEYVKFCDQQVERIGKQHLDRVPPDLDLQPYKDEEDYETIWSLVEKAREQSSQSPE